MSMQPGEPRPDAAPDAPGAAAANVYFAGLDSLRFIAAYAVVVSHIEQLLFCFKLPSFWHHVPVQRAGHEAVRFFFTLSGFLITYLLLVERKRTGTVAVGRFWMRRILRIWPLYFLIVISALWVWPRLPGFAWPGAYEGADTTSWAIRALYLLIFPNIVLARYGVVPFASHTWSIGYEEQFYVIWPLLMRLWRNSLIPIGLVLALGPGLRLPLAAAKLLGANIKSAPWSALDWVSSLPFENMSIGALGAYALFHNLRWVIRPMFSPLVQIGVMVPALGLLLAPWPLSQSARVLSLFYVVLIVNVAANPRSLVKLDFAWLRRLGQVSYGVYMYHPIAVAAAIHLALALAGGSAALHPLVYVLSTALTVAVALASYRWFESPMLTLKRRFALVRSEAPE